MAKAQLKLLLFLIVLGITLGCMAMAYYIYAKVLQPEKLIQAEMKEIKKSDLPVFDPGAKRFDAAMELIKAGKIEEGRDALLKLVQAFPESPKCAEAKRIVGEVNMDQFFSLDHKAGKRDYIVQPGDGLQRIAIKHQIPMDLIIRLNGLMGNVLQPGDHLTLVQADFALVVDVSEKTVELRRVLGDKEYFFKEYAAVDVRLPGGLKAPLDMEIKTKSAMLDGKALQTTDPRYYDADKWLVCSKGGLLLRTPPPTRPAAPAPAAAPAPGEAVGLPPPPEPGVFLQPADLEELFALLRIGSKLYLVR